jgi:glycosyltransferase involved in cell wall biosynthesis
LTDISPQKPRVSVGMAVLNGGELFNGAIESILRQSYSDIEIVISDNASTDGTPERAKAYAVRDARVRYFRQKKTISALQNYRFVLENARGDYFFWAPHDDWWDERFIEHAVSALDRHPNAALVMGTAHYIGRDGRELRNDHPPYGLHIDGSYARIKSYLTRNITDMLYYGVFRRSALADADWIDSTCPEKSIIMSALTKGPFIDEPAMQYFNRLSEKTFEEVAEFNLLPAYSLRYQWRTFRSIVTALWRGVPTWDFLRLLPVLIVAQKWHKQLVKDVLIEIGVMSRRQAR